MNLDELRTVQVEERGTDSLQSLPESFYADVAEYVAELREARDRAAADAADPFQSTTVRQLSDELETAQEIVEALYERRVGKVVKRASLAAAGIPTDEAGLTAEEAALFESLVGEIEANRRRVLDVLEGPVEASTADAAADRTDDVGGASPATDRPDRAPSDPDPFGAERAMGPGSSEGNEPAGSEPGRAPPDEPARATEAARVQAPDSESDRPDRSPADAEPVPIEEGGADGRSEPDRVPVRITQDVGEILGIDNRSYTLAEDDVVTLPVANAEPLLERDAAERLD